MSNVSEQTRTYLSHILSIQKPTAIASALRGMALRTSSKNLLANTTVPILIITGDEDVIISPFQSLEMHTLAGNSQLVELHNAGHLSNLEQPEHWNQAIIDTFLKEENVIRIPLGKMLE